MKRTFSISVLRNRGIFLFSLMCFHTIFGQKKISVDTILMGSPFHIVVYHEDENYGKMAIHESIKEIIRIENLISEWQPNTPVSEINRYAGKKAIAVNDELFHLLVIAKKYSETSEGIFDITYAGMERIWKYDGSMSQIPTDTQIKKALEGVGSQYLQLNKSNKTVFLTHPKTRISFGSIGKAYSVQKAMEVLGRFGIESALVNGSGDIMAIGNPPKKKAWTVGIFRPYKKRKYKKIHLKNEAIVTSGDYEKFALIGNKKYGHIIHPKTGMPSTEVSSVSVKGKDAVIANFLSTTLMLTNAKERRRLQKLFPDYIIWIQKRR